MAEGWLRHLAGNRFESLSAGANPAGSAHPLAVPFCSFVGWDQRRFAAPAHHFYESLVGRRCAGPTLRRRREITSLRYFANAPKAILACISQ